MFTLVALIALGGASVAADTFAQPRFAACKAVAPRLTRREATQAILDKCHACLDALEASRPGETKLGPEYFDVVPLLETRALQFHAYGGHDTAGRVASLAQRLRSVRSRLDPAAARPAATRAAMDAAVDAYDLAARSGKTAAHVFTTTQTRRGPQLTGTCPGQVRKPNASASLHGHHHMTFHGGTTLGNVFKKHTCALGHNNCAGIEGSVTRGAWASAKGTPAERRTAVETALLGMTGLAASERLLPARNGAWLCHNRTNEKMFEGPDPEDWFMYEPRLPEGAPLESRRIVWTTNVRHPAFFAMSRILPVLSRNMHLEFMMQNIVPWVKHVSAQSGHMALCESPSNVAAWPGLKELCATGVGRLKWKPGIPVPRAFGRADLEVAKERLTHFSVIILLEHYAEGLLAFCRRLKWKPGMCSTRPMHGAPHFGEVAAAAMRTSAPARRLAAAAAPPRRPQQHQLKVPHHNVTAIMEIAHLGLDAFADIVDETQLSQELYFYSRELNRAQHVELGLDPPGTTLFPPGEADAFAPRNSGPVRY